MQERQVDAQVVELILHRCNGSNGSLNYFYQNNMSALLRVQEKKKQYVIYFYVGWKLI
jgi:hypothetical protein